MILAGDVGGTKTILALYAVEGGELRELRQERYASGAHASLEEIVGKFLGSERVALRASCFGVAGAVLEGRSQATNLPWTMEEGALARATGAPRVKLLNDLESAAYGMLFLGRDDVCVLNAGARPGARGNVAVIAAGTGLGEAMLWWDGERHHPIASEGGHADFAPESDQEIELLRYLRKKYPGHVSWERVLSGPGLHNVYCFLRDTGHAPEPPEVAKRLAEGDPNVAITELGLAGEDALCTAALDLFARLYGAEAGNMALRCLATGGVFVSGGIAPRLLPALQKGSFMEAFSDKGRFSDLLRTLEVTVCLNPRVPLLGAAQYALRLAEARL